MRVFVHHPPPRESLSDPARNGDRIDALAIPVELIKGVSNAADWSPAQPAELKQILRYLYTPWKIRLDLNHHPYQSLI
ncbi:hypothetical protein [Thiohalorhabdus methylotrophus]|uniref:Transposase n=1 Tax=Thiohalorhabdus methylotrophus TaxID=3242694 RepID=A0ABV4U091_9GAMM